MSEYPGEVHGEKEHYDEGYKDAIQAVRDAVRSVYARHSQYPSAREHRDGACCGCFACEAFAAIEALGEPVEPTVRVDAKVLGRSIQSTTGKPPCWKCKGEERVDVGIAWCSNTHATCSECAGKASHAGGRT